MGGYGGQGGGGPLIGSGMKRWIADEAIRADMEHRGFDTVAEGTYRIIHSETTTPAGLADPNPTAWEVTVRDGSVEWQVKAGYDINRAPDLTSYHPLQTDVFGYWPGAVDEVFVGWEDMAEPDLLSYDATSVGRGAGEIQMNAETTGGSSTGLNTRLAADLEALKTRTGELNGEYAETFHEKYVAGLPGVLDNLSSMTQVLGFALAAEAGVFLKTREQVADIALQARAAMVASAPRSGSGLTGLKVALIVLGAAGAGVALFATGGTALAVAGSLTSAGAGATGGLLGALAKPPAAPPELPLGADTPQGVLSNLRAALEGVNTAVRAEETKIEALLQAAESDASAGKGNLFDIARPGIIDHEGSAVLEGNQLTTVDGTTIAKITELWIPSINGDVRACAAGLSAAAGSWSRPGNIGIGAQGAWPAYSALQSTMVEHLVNLTSELSGAADSLQQAAALIGRGDEDANRRLAREAERISSEDIDTI